MNRTTPGCGPPSSGRQNRASAVPSRVGTSMLSATTAAVASAISLTSGEERPGEVRGVERAQVLDPLPDPDQLHRDTQLVRDRKRDAALGGAVELRQDDPGDLDGLGEEARLLEPVRA